jgi:hypothetical protein
MISIYEAAKSAGLRIDSHESDLYLFPAGTARTIVRNVGTKEQIATACPFVASDGELWLEVPFAYEPFWANRKEAT